MTQYQIDADMLGSEFNGSCYDLIEYDFISYLAESTGRPEEDFLIRQHVSQWEGAEEPTDQEWTEALDAFVEDHPQLFE